MEVSILSTTESLLYVSSVLIFTRRFCISDYVTPAIDIYAFGMCALEMASLEIQGNGDSGTLVTQDHINRTIESLDDPLQKDLIYQCLTVDFEKRPTARTLLFHPVLFEVHGLKLLAAHALVKTGKHRCCVCGPFLA